MRILIIIFFIFLTGFVNSQIITPTAICNLPVEIHESSGLIIINDSLLLTHNDSGDSTRIFLYNYVNCGTEKEIIIGNHTMSDFEAIARDDSGHIYIGDFGNNAGNRTNLCILKVNLNDVMNDDTIYAEKIYFNYGDQYNFSSAIHNFDCESMFHFNDSLYLFSKNYNQPGNYCKRYVLPDMNGNYTIFPIDSIALPTWVTDVAIDTIHQIFLLQSETNLYEFEYDINPKLDTLRKTFIYSFASKKEGIGFKNGDTLIISDETNTSTGGNLYELNITSIVNSSSNLISDDLKIIQYENFIQFYNHYLYALEIEVYDLVGRLIVKEKVEPNTNFQYENENHAIIKLTSLEFLKTIKF